MFNFFKTGGKGPADSDSKGPWEEVRTEPVLGGEKAPEEKVAATETDKVSPFEEVPPTVPDPALLARDEKEGAPSDPVIPVWATTPEPEEEPSREAALEADRPEPMVTTPVPRETVRRVRDREREAQPEEESAPIPTPEEVLRHKRMRHRMIGAAALLLALVLVTPFALDDEKSLEVEKMNLDIPAPQAVETTIAPEAESEAEKPAHGDVVVAGSGESPSTGAANLEGEAAKETAPDPKAGPAEETKAPAKAEEAAKPAEPARGDAAKETAPDPKAGPAEETKAPAKAEEAAKPAEPARGDAAPTGEGYYIQVLATSSELSAEKLVKDMKLQGLPAYKMSVRQNGKTLWRVRVGLFKTKAEAESASGLLMLNNFASKPIVSHQKASKK